MVAALNYDHADQAKRRKRARVTQKAIAARLNISDSAVSDYEIGKKPLPFGLDPEDYERALLDEIAGQRGSR